MIRESSLAQELSALYSDLSIKGESYIEINGWLKLSLLISPLEVQEPCREFHSLLFFDSPKRLEPLLCDKTQNGILAILIKKCKYPTTSFQEIAEDEGIPFKAVKNAALHFVQWKKAKFIPKIDENSLFVNNPHFEYSRSLISEWERVFKHKQVEFLKILSAFSAPKSIRMMENLLFGKAKAIPVITWLLRKGVVQNVHYYLYLLYKSVEEMKEVNDKSEEFEVLMMILEMCDGKMMVEEVVSKTGACFVCIGKCARHFSKYLRMVVHYHD